MSDDTNPIIKDTTLYYDRKQCCIQEQNKKLSTYIIFFDKMEHDVFCGLKEINNMTDTPNNTGINNGLTSGEGVIQKPQVKEIVISRPVAEGKNRPKPKEQPKKAEFVF